MESELKSLNRRLFCLLNRITFKEEKDKKEAKAMVRAARQEATSVLDDTRKLAEKLVKEIREKDKKAIKEVRQILEREIAGLAEIPKPPLDVKPSDTVYIKSLHSSGTVTEVVGALARIDMGKFRVTVPISDLEK